MFSLADQLGLDQALTDRSQRGRARHCASSSIPTAVETLSQGKSLGKLAVGARIVRDDGGSIGFGTPSSGR